MPVMGQWQSTQVKNKTLGEITHREVERYAGGSHQGELYAMLDDVRRHYSVVFVNNNRKDGSFLVNMARVVGDCIIIEYEAAVDKPLVDALMVNGGVPREHIVLAYQGEPLPDTDATRKSGD